MPLANLANVLGGGNDESSGVTPGSFSSVTSTGGTFTGANGQTIIGNASGAWAITTNGSNQSIILTPGGTGGVGIGGTVQSGFGLDVAGAAVVRGGLFSTAAFTTLGGTQFLSTSTALTDSSAAQVATMTNGPVAGNPTKWVAINDNGTLRKIPTW